MKKYILSILVLISQIAFNQRDTIGGAVFTNYVNGQNYITADPLDFCCANNGIYYVLYQKNIGFNKSLECVKNISGNWVPADGVTLEVDTQVEDAMIFYNASTEDIFCAYTKADSFKIKTFTSGVWGNSYYHLGSYSSFNGALDTATNTLYFKLNNGNDFLSFDLTNGFLVLDQPLQTTAMKRRGTIFNSSNSTVYSSGSNYVGYLHSYLSPNWAVEIADVESSNIHNTMDLCLGLLNGGDDILIGYNNINETLVEIKSFNVSTSNLSLVSSRSFPGGLNTNLIDMCVNSSNGNSIILINSDDDHYRIMGSHGGTFIDLDEFTFFSDETHKIEFDQNGNLTFLYHANNKIYLFYYPSFTLNSNEKVLEETSIFIYPNPGNFNLFLSEPISGNFEIYNMQGAIVYSGELQGQNQIDIGSLNPGSYFLKLNSENGNTHTKQFLKF